MREYAQNAMKITSNAKLISSGEKTFTNKQGEDITFTQAILAVDGELFSVSVDRDARIVQKDEEGTATLDITERNGKMRMRLLGFE